MPATLSPNPPFALLLFSTDPAFVQAAVTAGVDAIMIDWEYRGKGERQASWDTQINRDSVEDLEQVRACTSATVVCRINRFGGATASEVEQAVAAGANEILLPMVHTAEEVEAVLQMVGGRCGLGVLVETVAAVERAEALAALPLSRVYVGLNDLAIERGTPNIFTALADGTVERARRPFPVPFGVAGLTLPDCGSPIPCRLLIGEMVRLNCQFSFLRRSFHRDIRRRDLAVEVPRIKAALELARQRTPEEIARDRQELEAAIAAAKFPA